MNSLYVFVQHAMKPQLRMGLEGTILIKKPNAALLIRSALRVYSGINVCTLLEKVSLFFPLLVLLSQHNCGKLSWILVLLVHHQLLLNCRIFIDGGDAKARKNSACVLAPGLSLQVWQVEELSL